MFLCSKGFSIYSDGGICLLCCLFKVALPLRKIEMKRDVSMCDVILKRVIEYKF